MFFRTVIVGAESPLVKKISSFTDPLEPVGVPAGQRGKGMGQGQEKPNNIPVNPEDRKRTDGFLGADKDFDMRLRASPLATSPTTDEHWAYVETQEKALQPYQHAVQYWRVGNDGDRSIPQYLHYVHYKDKAPGDKALLMPFRQVVSPTFNYEKDANQLTMTFWTNCKERPQIGDHLNQDHVVDIFEQDYSQDLDQYKMLHQVQCISYGSIHKMIVTGGWSTRMADWPDSTRARYPGTQTLFQGDQQVVMMIPIMQHPRVQEINSDGQNSNDQEIIPYTDFVKMTGDGGNGLATMRMHDHRDNQMVNMGFALAVYSVSAPQLAWD